MDYSSLDVITIDGIQPSAELREEMAGQSMLLAFSRGKDSIAAWLAMRDAGTRVFPFYRYGTPGAPLVEANLAYFEEFFGTKILRIPHPSFWRQLDQYAFQPPQRCRVIDIAEIDVPSYRDTNDLVCEHFGLDPKTTWIADGVRAADTPDRRRALSMYGPRNDKEMHVHIVWDWRLRDVWRAIDEAGITRPPDYALFNRSWDGKDYRYLKPLKVQHPDSYEAVLRWFPLADLEIFRREQLSRRHPELRAVSGKPGDTLTTGRRRKAARDAAV